MKKQHASINKTGLILLLAIGIAVPILYGQDDCVSEDTCSQGGLPENETCSGNSASGDLDGTESAYWLDSIGDYCGTISMAGPGGTLIPTTNPCGGWAIVTECA